MNWYWNKENCFLVVTRHLLPVSLYQRAIQRWREVWRPVTRNYRSSLKYPPFQHFIFYNYLIICHFTQQYTSHHILRHFAHIKGKKYPNPLHFVPKCTRKIHFLLVLFLALHLILCHHGSWKIPFCSCEPYGFHLRAVQPAIGNRRARNCKTRFLLIYSCIYNAPLRHNTLWTTIFLAGDSNWNS